MTYTGRLDRAWKEQRQPGDDYTDDHEWLKNSEFVDELRTIYGYILAAFVFEVGSLRESELETLLLSDFKRAAYNGVGLMPIKGGKTTNKGRRTEICLSEGPWRGLMIYFVKHVRPILCAKHARAAPRARGVDFRDTLFPPCTFDNSRYNVIGKYFSEYTKTMMV
jgi:hypothetical protein